MMDLTSATCPMCDLVAGKMICSARPPVRGEDGNAKWARVYPQDWCGEHPTRRAHTQLLFEAELERLRKEQADGR